MTLPATLPPNSHPNFAVQILEDVVQQVVQACHSFFFGPRENPGRTFSPPLKYKGPKRKLRRQNRRLARRSTRTIGSDSGSSSGETSIGGVIQRETGGNTWYRRHQSQYDDEDLCQKLAREAAAPKQPRVPSYPHASMLERTPGINDGKPSDNTPPYSRPSTLRKLSSKLFFGKLRSFPSFRRLGVQSGLVTVRYRNSFFRVHEILGEGNFATIMRVTDNFQNVYAMKVYTKARLKNSIREAKAADEKEIAEGKDVPKTEYLSFWLPAYEELEALSRISNYEDNPFLPHLRCAFEDEKNYYMVMNFYHESLLETINRTRLSLVNIRLYSAQLVCALESLHSLKIIHRDLKPENILISHRGDIALTDFNCASCFELNTPSRECISTDESGTASYMAPENFDKRQLCTWKADIWSLGLVMLDMFRDHITPAKSENIEAISEQEIHKVVLELVADKNAKNLITSMIQTDVELRPSLTEIKASPFFDEVNWTLLRNREYRSEYQPLQPDLKGREQATLTFKEELNHQSESEDSQDTDEPPPGPFEYELPIHKRWCNCSISYTDNFSGLRTRYSPAIIPPRRS